MVRRTACMWINVLVGQYSANMPCRNAWQESTLKINFRIWVNTWSSQLYEQLEMSREHADCLMSPSHLTNARQRYDL